jgi:hypothetical protein
VASLAGEVTSSDNLCIVGDMRSSDYLYSGETGGDYLYVVGEFMSDDYL